jgi:hypothetical protein
MEVIGLVVLVAIALQALKSQQQRQRIALLAGFLGNYQIEKLMENLTEGYLRCLGESDAERRSQIWQLLENSERQLSSQFDRFAAEFSKVGEAEARVSKLPIALPFAEALPAGSFDMRSALAIHARGIAAAMRNDAGQSAKDKAFRMSAELFLMQHSCHWYCKSKTVASARMFARHKTHYRQLIASVGPETRTAYLALIGAA